MDKKCGMIFCLFGVFFFKTEQMKHTTNKHAKSNMQQLNLKQWQVTNMHLWSDDVNQSDGIIGQIAWPIGISKFL